MSELGDEFLGPETEQQGQEQKASNAPKANAKSLPPIAKTYTKRGSCDLQV